MTELEEYGIKDVGFEDIEGEEEVPMVGEIRDDGAVNIYVEGYYKGRLSNPKRTGTFNDEAELFVNDHVAIWFDKVIQA